MQGGAYIVTDYQKLHARVIHIGNNLVDMNLNLYKDARTLKLTLTLFYIFINAFET